MEEKLLGLPGPIPRQVCSADKDSRRKPYSPPRLVGLGDIADLTHYDVSVITE